MQHIPLRGATYAGLCMQWVLRSVKWMIESKFPPRSHRAESELEVDFSCPPRKWHEYEEATQKAQAHWAKVGKE